MSKRKERKKRKQELIYEWTLAINEEVHKKPERNYEETNEALYALFQKFCREKGIDRPQDKTLRESIIIGAQEMLKTIAKEYYKTHPKEQSSEEGE
jgi:hypothetical protein